MKMKYSKQRELIFQAVREYPYHPSADDVDVYKRQTITVLVLSESRQPKKWKNTLRNTSAESLS